MKNIIILLMLVSSVLNAQENFTINIDVNIQNVNSEDLEFKMFDFFNTEYTDVKSMANMYIGNSIYQYTKYGQSIFFSGDVSYIVKSYVKDDKIEFIFTNFKHKTIGGVGSGNFSFGLITNNELYSEKGMKHHNGAWQDLKIKLKDAMKIEVLKFEKIIK